MRIIDLLAQQSSCVSFEFFPPKTDAGAGQLFDVIRELEHLNPAFVSVTYGAGGSTRQKTLDLVARIRKETSIEPMAHLTCVGHSRDEIRQILDKLVDAGVENVLALRGDPPKGEKEFVPAKDGFAYADELTAFIKQQGAPLCIGGACYPEGHLECSDKDLDLANLKKKVDAGAEFLITQLFFDNHHYTRFVQRAQVQGISAPIIPGIMPITNYKQVHRMSAMCGAEIPSTLQEELDMVQDNAEAVAGLGISFAIDQCRELRSLGTPGLHLFTLNKSPATRAILARLRHDPDSRFPH